MFTVLEGSKRFVAKVVERFGHLESTTPPWHQSRIDQRGSRTGRRDVSMLVVEYN